MATRCCSPPESARGFVVHPLPYAEQIYDFLELGIMRDFVPRDVASDGDVVRRAQRRQKIVLLKNEAHRFLAQVGALARRSS